MSESLGVFFRLFVDYFINKLPCFRKIRLKFLKKFVVKLFFCSSDEGIK